MPLRAGFIGVNRHSDPHISDLTGAVADANAFWALFSDSVPDLRASRLIDEEATLGGIRQLLDEVLGDAKPHDTCVLFFAGHGTNAHQIVPYDTALADVEGTTIPMQELAERLTASAARASLVILDCCFSGGAPARVLNVPAPRTGGLTAEQLGGKGRLVLAASKDNEPALELGQHGLFSRALLDAIAEFNGVVDVGMLMPDVAKRVAAEAARFGGSQTPVWAGLVEGGLSLPALRPGRRYADMFPDTSGVRVSKDIADLVAFGLPAPLLNAWTVRYPAGLNPLQLTAVNDLRVLDGESVLIVAPTTAGKTFVGELAAAKAIADGRKAVFLLPYRALVNEKYEDFQALYGENLNLRVVRCSGDYADDIDAFVRGKYDFALLTFEMFLRLSVGTPSVLAKIGLVVLDEAQFVTDETRGINVELLLTSLIASRERGIKPQIVALSAVIGDVNAFDEWLGCKASVTSERPVPLVEGVMDRSGVFQYLMADGKAATQQLLDRSEIVQRKMRPGSQDLVVPLVRKLVNEGEHVIVFRNTRGAVAGCANYLAQEMGLPPAHHVIASLPLEDRSGASYSLERALRGGAALHSTDLNREERLAVERAFRDPDGPVRALVATSSVAAGVNTPATTVIIVETFFHSDGGQTPYGVAFYKNMAGRAGRLGLKDFGRSVLLASYSIERLALFNKYVRASPEPMRSSFTSADLATWILRLLAQVQSVDKGEVPRLLANTYGGYLATRRDPAWRTFMESSVADLLNRMTRIGLIETEVGFVQLSLLGRVCGASSLTFLSIERLLERLRGPLAQGLTPERLMAVVQTLPEMDEVYTPVLKKGSKESQWQQVVTMHLGMDTTQALQRSVGDQFTYWGRCKRTAILLDWIAGTPIEEIEKRFSATPFAGSISAGTIASIADATRFHLRSALDITDVLLAGEGPDGVEATRLLTQLETGLPASALGILQLPLRLSRGRALALHAAGLSTCEAILHASREQLRAILGIQLADELQNRLVNAT